MAELAPPPPALSTTDSLFLDFDGTLVELAERPDAVVVAPSLVDMLDRLAATMPGRVAIVSGRSIAQLDAMLGPQARHFALAGSHGAERRTPEHGYESPEPPEALALAAESLRDYADTNGLVFEAKSFGAAIHYRQRPELEDDANAAAAAVADTHGLVLQRGKMMAEVRLSGDKGDAILGLLETSAMQGTRPLFFGDDVTDEDGFVAAAASGGAGVLIGPLRETAALYRLESVSALHTWIAAAMEARA